MESVVKDVLLWRPTNGEGPRYMGGCGHYGGTGLTLRWGSEVQNQTRTTVSFYGV